MSTQDKIAAVIAAITEHSAIYTAVRAPATAAAYNTEIVEGLRKGLVEKIAAIYTDKPQGQ
jgi:hypothetical protein